MNFGNIEKRGENSFRLTVSGGYDNEGKRIKHQKTVKVKSEREARKQLASFISDIEKGIFTSSEKLTFKEFSKHWYKNYAETNLEATTLTRYLELLEFNIYPTIGNLRLDQIKPLHLLNLYSDLAKDGARRDGKTGGYADKTIQHIHRLIRSILEKAVQWQMIAINPASRIQPPKVTKREVDFYSDEEIKLLLIALKDEPIKYKTIVILALHTGLRRSEIAALEWNDLDFDNHLIYINKAAVYTPEKGRIVKDTKTVRSNRCISMSDTLYKVLKEYQKWQEENKFAYGDMWIETNIVFSRENGLPIHTDTITSWFIKFIKRKNLLHISFHGLRHTHATLLISSGVDIETVSRLLGHATSITTSSIYLHSAQEVRADAIKKLNDRFEKMK